MKILVTGGSGFIGTFCLSALKGVDCEIHVADIVGSNTGNSNNVNWYKINLFKRKDVRYLMQKIKPTHLLHLAWNMEHGVVYHSAKNIDWLKASLDLVTEFADAGGKRIVTAGSCAEYSWNRRCLNETKSPLAPATIYGAAKHSLQMLTSEYCRTNGLSSAHARIFFTYGPGENMQRLVPYIITQLLKNGTVELKDGSKIRDYIYVRDVAEAFVSILISDFTGPVNIGSGKPTTINDIAYTIAEIMDKSAPIIDLSNESSGSTPEVILADNLKLTSEVGYKLNYSLENGLSESISWFKNQINNKT